MAGIFGLLSGRHEPFPRMAHSAATAGRKTYFWGGRTRDFSEKSREKLGSVVETFDPYLEQWEQQITMGTPPPGLYNGACASLKDSLYVCAGTDGISYHSSLHQLNTTTLKWSEPHQLNPMDGPMRKVGCGMISYSNDTLVLFGGFGISSSELLSVIKTRQFPDDRKWTDELHLFNIDKGQWSSPSTAGTRPPPCSNFSFTKIDHHRAVVFGGGVSTGRTSDVFIIDLKTMYWTKVEKSIGVSWPMERTAHAACCLNYGQESPHLLISGGVGRGATTLSDVWLFDVDSKRWSQPSLPEDVPSTRVWHSLTAVSLAPGLTEVTMFGGCLSYNPNLHDDKKVKMAETTVITLENLEFQSAAGKPPHKEWIVMSVAKGGQLGLKEAGEKMARMSQKMADYSIRVRQQLREAKQLQIKYDKQIQEQSYQQQRQQQTELVEGGLKDDKRRLLPRREKEEPFWVVQREEIELAEEEELGRGGWAVVKVARFRGTCVAAKFLHGMIASDNNRELFIREMTLASRVRHPNLLQFIGATLSGELVILTELMPTNLRAEIEKRAASNHTLSPGEVLSVGLDVSRALNYLHLMKPDPIIHRDISSANVLLELTPNNSWRAKVSDYGSANFLQRLKTIGPGNPSYAAPEAELPVQQSTKMDIFSLGVLLVEMATCCFPNASSREHDIGLIHHPELVTVIRQCLLVDRDRRPSARELLAQLNSVCKHLYKHLD